MQLLVPRLVQMQAHKGLFSFVSFTDKLQQRQIKQAQDEYKKEIEFLANKPSFTLIDFRQRTVDGLVKLKKGLKYKFASGVEQTEQQLTQQKQILNAMFDEELLDPESLNGEVESFYIAQKKKEIAMVAQVQVQDVNTVLSHYKSMQNLHRWIREKKTNNEPLPDSQEELNYRFRQEKPVTKSFLKFEYRQPKLSQTQRMQRIKWGARSVM